MLGKIARDADRYAPFRTVFVNSEGRSQVRLARNSYQTTQKTSEIGSAKALDVSVHLLFLPQITLREVSMRRTMVL
jgi:hypothetical protein